MECTEVALNETLQQLNSAPTSSPCAKEEWVSTVTQLLTGIEVCFSEEPQLLANFPRSSSLARLANNLIQVRSVQLGGAVLFWFELIHCMCVLLETRLKYSR